MFTFNYDVYVEECEISGLDINTVRGFGCDLAELMKKYNIHQIYSRSDKQGYYVNRIMRGYNSDSLLIKNMVIR